MAITVSGAAAARKALAQVDPAVRASLAEAVRDEADQVTDDARSHVRVDSGDLQQSIAPQVTGLSAEIRPRSALSDDSPKDHAIKAAVNEFGKSNDPGQPYMVPAAEASRNRWPTRAADAVRRAVDG